MPTESEIQTQWKNLVNILEKTRAYADDDLVSAGGYVDVLFQSLEGEYLPVDGAAFGNRVRALLSAAVDQSQALAALEPVLYEYASVLSQSATLGYGSGFSSARAVFPALFQWLHDNSASVATRAITYTAVSAAGSNVGNAGVSRLTKDRFGYNLEACTPEKKMLKCIVDQNSGAQKWAENFEMGGMAAGFDGLRRGLAGSGESSRTVIRAKHAGSGPGGSMLNNSSFSNFTASATSGSQFNGWVETIVGALTTAITQDTTNYYRTHPNAGTNASMKLSLADAGHSITLKQSMANMRIARLDPNTPYFLRVMVNKTVGSAAGGSVSVKLGSNAAVSSTVTALGSGWVELLIPFDKTCWLEEFGEDDFDVEIAWSGGTSGFMLFDDMIFCPWDLVDGTYWAIHQNNGTPVANMVQDEYYTVDTGGDPGTGILQYWCWISGLGYLPSDATPTIADPT